MPSHVGTLCIKWVIIFPKLCSVIVKRKKWLGRSVNVNKQPDWLGFMLQGPLSRTSFVLYSLAMYELHNRNAFVGCLKKADMPGFAQG